MLHSLTSLDDLDAQDELARSQLLQTFKKPYTWGQSCPFGKIEGAGLVYHLSSFSCCERGKHDIIMTSMVGECDMCDAVMHHSIVGWTWTCGHCTPRGSLRFPAPDDPATVTRPLGSFTLANWKMAQSK